MLLIRKNINDFKMYLGICSKFLMDLKSFFKCRLSLFYYKVQEINRKNIFQAATMEILREQEARCHHEHSPLL